MFYSPALGIDNTAMPWRHPRWKREEGQRRFPSFFFSDLGFLGTDRSTLLQHSLKIAALWRFTQKTIHSTEDGLFHWFHSYMGKQSPGARLSSLRNSERFPPRPKARMICIQCDVMWAVGQLRTGSIVTCYASLLLHASLLCRILYIQHRPLDSLAILHGGDISHICIFMNLCIFLHIGDKYTNI